MELFHKKHRLHIKVGKYAEEDVYKSSQDCSFE